MGVIGVYHHDCVDGTAAAAVLLRRYPEARVYPLTHAHRGEEIAELVEGARTGDSVFTLDCAIGVRAFLDAGYKVTTIDHHRGVQGELTALAEENSNFSYIFDNDKSGASLAWAHFFPDEDAPTLIHRVEDVDLWRWRYGDDSKHINNYLSVFRDRPDVVLPLLDSDLMEAREKGAAISLYADREIADLAKMPGITLTVGSFTVPAFNVTTHASAAGNALSEQYGKAVILFTVRGAQVAMSIRSCEGQTPTALDLAELLGGGGHHHAAGATVSLSDFIRMIHL